MAKTIFNIIYVLTLGFLVIIIYNLYQETKERNVVLNQTNIVFERMYKAKNIVLKCEKQMEETKEYNLRSMINDIEVIKNNKEFKRINSCYMKDFENHNFNENEKQIILNNIKLLLII